MFNRLLWYDCHLFEDFAVNLFVVDIYTVQYWTGDSDNNMCMT